MLRIFTIIVFEIIPPLQGLKNSLFVLTQAVGLGCSITRLQRLQPVPRHHELNYCAPVYLHSFFMASTR
jgi:hypothetical protein